MRSFLVFTLAAPIASFGTIAVGERRPTWDRPSKSQVIGLVAAALGIERQEAERQRRLTDALLFAVRIDEVGHLQADYHTTQVPPQRRNRRFATRADELAVDKTALKTILSRRELRIGSLHTIALATKADADAAYAIATLAQALKEPVYVPFAGRKANTLSLPMAPRLVTAATIVAAFRAYDAVEPPEQTAFRQRYWLTPSPSSRPRYYADAALAGSGDRILQHEQRRDMPTDRARWRFDNRAEVLLDGGLPS